MTVLITGANRGIGAEMMHQYQARNQRVIGTTRGAEGRDMLSVDVISDASLQDLSQSLSTQALDLLICSAGVYQDKGRYIGDDLPSDLWAQTFAANVTGVYKTIEACLPALRRSDKARIAIIGSQMGTRDKAQGGSYIYRASKAAVINLAFNLAHDLRKEGIAVGVYHPGWVQTDMGGEAGHVTPEASASQLIGHFDRLDMSRSGEFLAFDGAPHAL
ncbi:SDR family NAD(P)-dependent oxidoreductase [Thalassobius sp. I31.1]|uniref:SDR family NAD(P)-dependent oxidoreductase n=1 Tax=Thalassobius sp. I31.1 TaxID=2109912 RepID=UPI000D1BE0C0|nr:SDR family NAD(P)-dependent oxidoreductase [Thalassobius sp. I31.1]